MWTLVYFLLMVVIFLMAIKSPAYSLVGFLCMFGLEQWGVLYFPAIRAYSQFTNILFLAIVIISVLRNMPYINFNQLVKIIASWIVSPLLSATFSFILMVFVARLILDTQKKSFTQRFHAIQIISASCFSISTVILFKLAGFKQDGEDQETGSESSAGTVLFIILLASIPVGLILLRITMLIILRRNS